MERMTKHHNLLQKWTAEKVHAEHLGQVNSIIKEAPSGRSGDESIKSKEEKKRKVTSQDHTLSQKTSS